MVAAEAAMIAIAGAELLKVLDEGRPRYGARWLTLDTDYFVDHAFKHIIAIRAGENTEDHIAHALCDLAMATYLRRTVT